MQAKPYFCITCYDIINIRHKHTFDIYFPPELVPVVLPHFFFSSIVSISVLLLFSVLTHPILYISFPYDTSVLLHFSANCLTSLLLLLSLNFFLPFFFLNFSFPYHNFCQAGLSGHRFQCCVFYMNNPIPFQSSGLNENGHQVRSDMHSTVGIYSVSCSIFFHLVSQFLLESESEDTQNSGIRNTVCYQVQLLIILNAATNNININNISKHFVGCVTVLSRKKMHISTTTQREREQITILDPRYSLI